MSAGTPRPRRADLFLALVGLMVLAALLARSGGRGGSAACPPPGRIQINEACEDLLMLLPGLGPARAGAILSERTRRGPFNDGPDFARRMPELGPAVHRAILPFLDFQAFPGTRL